MTEFTAKPAHATASAATAQADRPGLSFDALPLSPATLANLQQLGYLAIDRKSHV